jgi:hypothetical protein
MAAGEAFAETLIRCSAFSEQDYQALGYWEDNVLRFDTPEKLFAHVKQVLQLYAAKAGQGQEGQPGGGDGQASPAPATDT